MVFGLNSAAEKAKTDPCVDAAPTKLPIDPSLVAKTAMTLNCVAQQTDMWGKENVCTVTNEAGAVLFTTKAIKGFTSLDIEVKSAAGATICTFAGSGVRSRGIRKNLADPKGYSDVADAWTRVSVDAAGPHDRRRQDHEGRHRVWR